MCKINKKWGDTRIDPCMKPLIKAIERILPKHLKLWACCCGHGKYKMTIVMKNVSLTSHYNDGPLTFDFISDKEIKRRFKFYKKDKQGYYYIPEVVQ